jgi:hypothetical protein
MTTAIHLVSPQAAIILIVAAVAIGTMLHGIAWLFNRNN